MKLNMKKLKKKMNTLKIALLEDLGYLEPSLPPNELNEGLKTSLAAGALAATMAISAPPANHYSNSNFRECPTRTHEQRKVLAEKEYDMGKLEKNNGRIDDIIGGNFIELAFPPKPENDLGYISKDHFYKLKINFPESIKQVAACQYEVILKYYDEDGYFLFKESSFYRDIKDLKMKEYFQTIRLKRIYEEAVSIKIVVRVST